MLYHSQALLIWRGQDLYSGSRKKPTQITSWASRSQIRTNLLVDKSDRPYLIRNGCHSSLCCPVITLTRSVGCMISPQSSEPDGENQAVQGWLGTSWNMPACYSHHLWRTPQQITAFPYNSTLKFECASMSTWLGTYEGQSLMVVSEIPIFLFHLPTDK